MTPEDYLELHTKDERMTRALAKIENQFLRELARGKLVFRFVLDQQDRRLVEELLAPVQAMVTSWQWDIETCTVIRRRLGIFLKVKIPDHLQPTPQEEK